MPNESVERALLMQFAKWPEPGRVKTRLAPALGEQRALNAHITLTLAVINQLAASSCELRFMWDREAQPTPEAATPVLDRIETLGLEQGIQRGRLLGDRMATALAEALVDYPKALIVGSDCPAVDAAYVHAALEALEQADVVLGPSDDGGYVLIGARACRPEMLSNIRWGTDRALADTLLQLEAVGLTCVQLPPRWDVDEPEDWQRFVRQFPEYV